MSVASALITKRVDVVTSQVVYADDETRYLKSVEDYKRRHNRPFMRSIDHYKLAQELDPNFLKGSTQPDFIIDFID